MEVALRITLTNEMIKKALQTAELRAKKSVINLGMADNSDDDDDDQSSENDLPVNDAYITSMKTVHDVVKDVNVLHQNNVVDLSVKKKQCRKSEMKIPVYTSGQ